MLLEQLAGHLRAGLWAEADVAKLALRTDAASGDELQFLLDNLIARGMLVQRRRPVGESNEYGEGRVTEYRLTVDGWRAAKPLGNEGTQGVAFVAMSFASS